MSAENPANYRVVWMGADGNHLGPRCCQDHRQGSQPGANLQDVAARSHLGQVHDPPGQGGFDQEMLPEGFARADAVTARQVSDAGGREAWKAATR